MSESQDLFLLDLPRKILDSPFLVEASAGTGKTYMLTRLVFAYLIHKDIALDEILVITFTRNATSELRDRLHTLTQEFLRNPDLDPMIKSKIRHVAADFDSLSIMTINGFFQRIYLNTSLETGFNADLDTSSDQTWLKEVAQDYFRRYVHEIEQDRPLQLGLYAFLSLIKIKDKYSDHAMFARNFSDGIQWLAQNILSVEFLKSENILPNVASFEQAWRREESYEESHIYRLYHEFLHSEKNLIEKIALGKDMGLRATSLTDLLILLKQKPDSTNTRWKKLSQMKNPLAQELHQELLPLIDDGETKDTHLASMAAHFLRHFFGKCQLIKEEKKQQLGLMAIDHPNKAIYDLLAENTSPDLARQLNPGYRVALIDEFQDTNFFQWTVLQRLFSPDLGPNYTYALIGDPKQLIYYFRGATPLTYSQVKNLIHEDQLYKMQKNYRSHPAVLAGINAWFSQVFAHTIYGYTPVFAGKEDTEFLIGPDTQNHKGITFLQPTTDSQGLGLGKLTQTTYELYTHQILELLTNPAYQLENEKTGEKRPIKGSDIVCLVQTGYQAKDFKKVLDQSHIPCILLLSQHSIYDCEEFDLILLVLRALANPGSKKIRHALLISPLIGLEMEALLNEEKILPFLEKFYLHFNAWQEMASTRQIAKIFDELFHEYGYFTRLMQKSDGERRFVNMRHLISLLLKEERAAGLNSGALYFYQRMMHLSEKNHADDIAKIRLETENHAIRISNIHQVKGLEYPIVFGIFGIKMAVIENQDFLIQKDQETLIDLSCNKEYGQDHLLKQFEESMRAFYVLATRAKSHLFLPLLHTTKNCAYLQTLAYLVSDLSASEKIIHYAVRNKEFTPTLVDEVIQTIKRLCTNEESPFSIKTLDLEDEISVFSEKINAQIRSFQALQLANSHGFYDRILQINSYSSLWQKKQNQEEDDRISETHVVYSIPEDLPLSPLTISGGTELGNTFHHLVENLPFSDARQSLVEFCQDALVEELIRGSLMRFMSVQYHRQHQFLHTLKIMLWNTLNTPIAALENTCLCDLEEEQKRHEVEFLMHVPQHAWLNTIEHKFEVQEGFLRGFLDLIFIHKNRYYVLDWKTTSLGYDLDNYSQEHLAQAMREHGYDMQARLYLYILTRYLYGTFGAETYEKIGGAIYLFNRAVGPKSDHGVYFFRPTYEEILSLLDFS